MGAAPSWFLLVVFCLSNSAWSHAQTTGQERALAVALAELNQGRVLEAIDMLKQIVREEPQFSPPYFYLSTLYTEMGEYETAERYLHRAFPENSKPAAHYHQMGVIQYRQKNWREALTLFEQALQLGAGADEATVWRSIGGARKELFDWDEAARAYENALQLQPKDARTQLMLGQFHLDRNQLARAVSEIQAALEIDPRLSGAHAGLGRAYRRSGNTQAAIATLKTALELNSSDQESRYALGQALLAAGRNDEGRRELDHYRRVQEQVSRANANYDSAVARIQAGELAQAEKLLTEAVDLAPTYGPALYSFGTVLLDRGKPEKAAEMLKRSAAANPLNPETHFSIGAAYAALGKHQEALEATRKAVVLREEEPRYHRQLGELYLKLNRAAEAREAFKTASELQ